MGTHDNGFTCSKRTMAGVPPTSTPKLFSSSSILPSTLPNPRFSQKKSLTFLYWFLNYYRFHNNNNNDGWKNTPYVFNIMIIIICYWKRRKMPNKHIVSVTVIVIDAVKFAAVIFVVIVFIIASESRTGRVNDCGWLLRAQLRGVYKKNCRWKCGDTLSPLSEHPCMWCVLWSFLPPKNILSFFVFIIFVKTKLKMFMTLRVINEEEKRLQWKRVRNECIRQTGERKKKRTPSAVLREWTEIMLFIFHSHYAQCLKGVQLIQTIAVAVSTIAWFMIFEYHIGNSRKFKIIFVLCKALIKFSKML